MPHAGRRAQLRVRVNVVQQVVIVTKFPDRIQVVILLGDGCVIGSLPYLKDDAFPALESVLGVTPDCDKS